MKKNFTLLIVVVLCLFQKLRAQYLQFTENKGQWHSSVKYKARFKNGDLVLTSCGYRVVLHDKDGLKKMADFFSGHKKDSSGHNKAFQKFVLHSHAYEVNFDNADSNAVIMPEKPLSVSNNYFIGNDSSKWRTGCKVFNALTYKNIYRNIDVRFYSDNGNLKYDILINPGGDIGKLALTIKGLDGLSVNKYGNLSMKTSLGEMYQSIPSSYQVIENFRSQVKAGFKAEGNTVRFKLGNYDKRHTLVIDPTVIFSTFTGSITDNWGYTATYDNAGNFYAGGIAFGAGYDPKNVGGYEQTYNGGDESEGLDLRYDIAVTKFNSTGTLALYATYIGGSGNEQPHSLVVNLKGELVISGRTTSEDFPVTAATYGPGGLSDIFLAKLSADGKALVASRKFGGSDADGVNISPKYIKNGIISTRRNYGDDARSEVIVDDLDNIYLASCTRSANFKTTANAFRKQLGGGQDGVFIKASSDLNNIFNCSYLGGNEDDAAFVLIISSITGNIYVAGGTNSTDLALNASNAPQGIIHNVYQGGEADGFISEISADANKLLKTCYAGTNGSDMIYGVQSDKFGNTYITGTTTNTSFPVVNSPFNANGYQATGKQFITKLNAGLTTVIYSANFGTGGTIPDISPTAFLVDICGNAYVSGWGGKQNDDYYSGQTTQGLSVTPNALTQATDGSDFYFFVLEKNALSQLFGSFYGAFGPFSAADHVDGGTSRFDKRGVIYQGVCADCNNSGNFPTTTGSWSTSNAAIEGCNEAAIKIAIELSGVISSIRSSINGVPNDTAGCVPLTVVFEDTLALGKRYQWNFGDGIRDTTAAPQSIHTYTNTGFYRVSLITIDSATCNIADTSYITIKVGDKKADVSFDVTKLLPCEALNYQFTNTSAAPAGLEFKDGDFTWDFGDGTRLVTNEKIITHQYAASGMYKVKLYLNDTAFCNSPDSAVYDLRVAAILVAQFETPSAGCAPYNAVLNNTSLGGQTFAWNFGDGTTSTEVMPAHLYTTPGIYTVTLSVTDNFTCNKTDDTTLTITIYESPIASFTYSPTVPKENTPYEFANASLGAVNYKWLFGDGDSLVTASMLPVTHLYNTSGNYSVCLVAFNARGCTDTACQMVTSIVTPLVDVPNAFTPNGDGTNDIVFVKGYGIGNFNWNIYNRWGQKMFTSTSLNTGWNGRFKDTLQPQDVYVYTLSIDFTDGTKLTRKGDITLLR